VIRPDACVAVRRSLARRGARSIRAGAPNTLRGFVGRGETRAATTRSQERRPRWVKIKTATIRMRAIDCELLIDGHGGYP